MILHTKQWLLPLAILNQFSRLFSILLVTGLLSFSIHAINSHRVEAAPQPSETTDQQLQSRLGSVITAVLEDASQRSGLPASAFQEITAQRTTWPDGCLGLDKPGQVCTQALVPGWRITLSHDSQTWVYHTATDGRIRLASQETCNQQQTPKK